MASSVLAPVQERGRAALEQLGLPNRRQEPWRLTDLKRLAAIGQTKLFKRGSTALLHWRQHTARHGQAAP